MATNGDPSTRALVTHRYPAPTLTPQPTAPTDHIHTRSHSRTLTIRKDSKFGTKKLHVQPRLLIIGRTFLCWPNPSIGLS